MNKVSKDDEDTESKTEGIMRFLNTAFVSHVIAESLEERGEVIALFDFAYQCVFEIDHTLLNNLNLSKGKPITSIVYLRLFDWQRIILWTRVAAYTGAYESVAREMRFLFEDVIQSIYIEKTMGDSDADAKLRAHSILDDFKLRGSKVIEKVVTGELRNACMLHYSKLSGYVHPTQDIVEASWDRNDDTLSYEYEEKLFDDSIIIFRETVDIIFTIIIANYPEMSELFTRADEFLELEHYGFKRTLMINNKITNGEFP